MGRIRSVKPGYFTSEEVAALRPLVRLHFIGLWTYADDAGRGLDNPRLIKAAVWPLDDDVTLKKIEAFQQELAENGRIVRYEVDGRRYFEVLRFAEHQKPNRPNESTHPSFADDGASIAPSLPTPEQLTADAVNDHGGITAGIGEGGEKERRGIGETRSAPLADFDRFWSVYPRKTAIGAARKAWPKALKTADADAIVAGAIRYRDDPNRDPSFTAHASTWLNQERWNDDPLPVRNGRAQSGIAAVLRAQAAERTPA